MSLQSVNNQSIRRYLLGELSEEEREQVEQSLMSDDDLYQQLLISEDDLIDEYVSGTLPEAEQAKFNQRFLSVPELRQDVRFARVLRKHALDTAPLPVAQSTAATRVPFFYWFKQFFTQPAFSVLRTVVFLAVSLSAAWLIIQNTRLRDQVEQLRARVTPTPPVNLQEELASERLRNEQLTAELHRQQELANEAARNNREGQQQQPQPPRPTPAPTSQTRTGSVMIMTLTPGLVRGEPGEAKKFSVSPATREVRMQLDLPAAEYSRYKMELKTIEGQVLLSRQGLRAGNGGKFVSVGIHARSLKPNDYRIVLSGLNDSGEFEEISSYYFRVLE